MRKIEIEGYLRISKNEAKKLFERGNDVRVVPCKCRPDNMWTTQDWNIKNFGPVDDETKIFENICNAWNYYNASYELGYYPAFYKKI